MNKRFLILLLLGTLAMSAGAGTKSGEVKGAHPWKTTENGQIATDCSHWSLIFDAGFNSFDGDFNSEMKHPVYAPAVGASLEYSFTPIIALGINYTFDMYRITGDVDAGQNADILLKGMMHKAGAYLSVDLMNCFFTRADHKIFGFQLLGGGGAGCFKNSIYFTDESRGHTANVEPLEMDKYRARPYLMGGVNFEFNLSRSVALGVRGTYSYFTKDDIDGRGYQGLSAVASKNNDGIFDVTLNLRYKIDAVHKTHVRNIASEMSIDKQLATNNSAKQPKNQTNAASHVDTVVVVHRDTVVLKSQTTTTVAAEKNEDYYFVYFDTGKSSLSSEGLITIQQVATRLERETQRYAVVYGYCDNTGSESVNNLIGEARAEAVMNELIEEYGIDAERITACGRGRIVGKRSKAAYGPNRRAEVCIVGRAEFEQLKAECSAEHRQAVSPTKQIGTSASAAANTIEQAAGNGVLDEVNVVKDMTLSQLARKYYQNTHCWVYIYKANRKTISNPNALTAGTHLVIPELTETQRTITKDKCLEMYKSLRAGK